MYITCVHACMHECNFKPIDNSDWVDKHNTHRTSHSASSQFGWGRNAKKCLPAQCNLTVYGHICMSFYMCSLVSCVCGDQVRSYLYTVCVLLCLWCRMWLWITNCNCVWSYTVQTCKCIYCLCKVTFVYSMCSVVSVVQDVVVNYKQYNYKTITVYGHSL